MAAPGDRRVFAILFLALFTSTLGIGIIVPILPLYAKTLGASGIWIGLIFSVFFLAQFLAMPIVGKLSDLNGRKVFITSGLFLYSVFSLGFIFATSPEILSLVRFGQGVSSAMIIPIAQAYVGEICPSNQEGKYMGLFYIALFAGFGVGPLLGGILEDFYGMTSAFYVLSGLTFFAGLFALVFLPEVRRYHENHFLHSKTFAGLLRSSVVRSLIAFRSTMAMSRGAIIAFVPIFACNHLQLSGSQIGVVISSNILLTSILQIPCGILADKVSRKKLVILGGFLSSSLLLTLPLVRTFTHLLFISLFYGIFGALMLPAATAIMVVEGRNYGMGSAMSLFNMSMTVGLTSGPPVAGLIADIFGISSVFYFLSALGFFGIGFFVLNCRGS